MEEIGVGSDAMEGAPAMILVVDDQADARNVLARLLRSRGYEAVALEGGNEALRFLEINTPNLVILDFNMPRLSGHDVLRAMRADSRWRDVPVLMFSAEDSTQRGVDSLHLGAQGYAVKGLIGWTQLFTWIQQYAAGAPPAAREPWHDNTGTI